MPSAHSMQDTAARVQRPKTARSPTADDVRAAFRGPPQRWLRAGAHRVAHRAFGQGPDVVFVHGWPLTSATFRNVVPALADRFTCHLVDLPGSGDTTSDSGGPIGFDAAPAALRGAIDALGLARYALVAHDSGGLVARLVAADDPRVAALVLGNTELPSYVPAVVRQLLVVTRLPGGADVVRFAMKRRAVRRSPLGYRGCFDDVGFIDGDFHELLVAPLLASKEAWGRQIDLLRSFDLALADRLAPLHARIKAPVKLVWGEDDPIFPIERARRMVGQFGGGATLDVIPRGRAFVHEEQPEVFAARAASFLEALPRRESS